MPIGRMRISMTVLSATLALLTVAMLVWLGRAPDGLSASDGPAASGAAEGAGDTVFHLGLIPERDIFAQRRRYRALADYLSDALGLPVELVTSNTYHGALNDMARGRIDAAFMGSMVATLTLDQLNARVLVKPQTADGATTYRGVIFVRDDSPIQSLSGLAGRSIAMVRTTTAGHLFPVYALTERGLLAGDDAVVMRWVGTHDRAVEEVFDGRVQAGAAKDLRVDAFEQAHEGYRFRRLAASEAVPNNALIVRRELDGRLIRRLRGVLLEMDQSEAGRAALSAFGAQRFVPCQDGEYRAVYEMVERLGPGWGRVGQPYGRAAQGVTPEAAAAGDTPTPGGP
jgi:phosphonate transport system substrate-binding protein